MDISSNETSDFDIDILRQIQSEWEGNEPSNFFLLLAALLIFVVWTVFISFFFSRILGVFIGHWFSRFLKWSGVTNIVKLSIGSFSISILSGKIMFREMLLVTDDYTLRINDGWIILSYWKYLPKNATIQNCMNVSRLHILMNGLKFHIHNRLSIYQGIAKQTGMAQFLNNLNGNAKDLACTNRAKTNSEILEMQLDAWWDKIWRLFGAIRFDISSGRLIAGNHTLPTACAMTFENLHYASNKDEDRYMFRLRGTVENVRIALVKATDFIANDQTNMRQEDPPRTMGDGFAILQTSMIQFYYHQDLLGLVKESQQSPNLKVPVWETIWRLGKSTVFSYGPWADKQRALIYSFFFPSDYNCAPITEMPKKGERRILINHDVRISLLHDASIDFWFMRNEELNAIHSRVKQGSTFEFYIPFIVTETGYISEARGSLLCLESTTSLPFREFVSCETLRFNILMHYPRAYNHHQIWDFCVDLHHFSTYVLWDHKRFVMDIIGEWNSDNTTDLCKFIPFTWNFNINVVDKFEIILLLNDKNWVDSSSSQASENFQAAIVGSRLHIDFGLKFIEFEPDTIPFELKLKAENNLAVRTYIPPQSPLAPIVTALYKTSNWQSKMRPSKVKVSIATDENWIELWRTELLTLKCEYEYYSLVHKFQSDIPSLFIQQWIMKSAVTPWKLNPDNLFFDVEIGNSEILLSGLLVKVILNFKDNYFGSYDQISDVSTKPLHSANIMFNTEKTQVEHYRPMNTFFKLKIKDIYAHCLTHKNLNSSNESKDFCPIISADQLLVELKKNHSECLIQLVTILQFLDSFLVLALSSDEEMEMPEKMNICQHFENIRFCTKSNLKIIDNRNRYQKCESVEALKYRIVRVSIDLLNLFIEENQYLIELCIENSRTSFCNAHHNLFYENLLMKIDSLMLHQYVGMDDSHKNWLRCGSFATNKINFDVRLPCKLNEHYLAQQRKQFLYKHDKASNCRLYFLWQKDGAQNCSCFGASRFFADFDSSGNEFFSNNPSKLANKQIQKDPLAQPFFLQSILEHSCGIRTSDRKESTFSGCSLDTLTENDNEVLRKASDASFHSASSQKYYESTNVYANLKGYADFLELFSCDNLNNFSLQKVSNGISSLKLIRKEDTSKKLSRITLNNSETSSIIKNDYCNRQNNNPAAFEITADCGNGVNVFLSVLSLKAIEQFVVSLSNVAQSIHPAFFAQGIYRKCSIAHHEQPLTTSIIYHKKDNFAPSNLYISVAIPETNVCLLHCSDSEKLTSSMGVNSVALFQLLPSHFKACPPTTRENLHDSLLFDWKLTHSHFELLQIVERKVYDNVFNKVPVIVLTNWHDIAILTNLRDNLCTKIIFDVHIPEIILYGTIGKLERIMPIKNQPSMTKIRSGNSLKVNINTISVVSVLGKSIEDPPNNSIDSIQNQETSFFETLTPILSAWSEALVKCGESISSAFATTSYWMDLLFLKLLAEALDWQDDRSIIYSDKPNRMHEVKLYSRNTNSCPSCKLIQKLLQYVTHNDPKIQEYLKDTMEGCSVFKKKNMRKTAAIALLSHWQTLVCCDVQLADNVIAHKYKYDTPLTNYNIQSDAQINANAAADQSETAAVKTPKSVFGKGKKETKGSKSFVELPSKLFESYPKKTVSCMANELQDTLPYFARDTTQLDNERSTALPFPSSQPSSSMQPQFRPSHRCGPSTATQLTISGNDSEPHDLYHRILKAHKELKERRGQLSTKKLSDTAVIDVNSMDLLLSVFFWTLFEELELERSLLDFFCVGKSVVFDFGFNLEELKFGIVEKKFLLSQQNDVLVALSSNPLISIENIELFGKLNFETKLDEYLLRPNSGNCIMEYTAKIQDVRLVISLASVLFINDLTMIVKYLKAHFENFSWMNRDVPNEERFNSPVCSKVNDNWTTGVLDKLYDYQRSCTYRRHDFFHFKIIGDWSLKTAVLESMITDLFISMTLLKIHFNQKHSRLCTSFEVPEANGTTDINVFHKSSRVNTPIILEQETQELMKILVAHNFTTEPSSISNLLPFVPFIMDYVNFSLKRANFIVAEHVLMQENNSDTRQILNCSLRETSLVYERLAEKFKATVPLDTDLFKKGVINKLCLLLGELEGDLPMHAQSIHEMVLRHGHQLNERLHKIVGQPQLVHSTIPRSNSIFKLDSSNLSVSDAGQENKSHENGLTWNLNSNKLSNSHLSPNVDVDNTSNRTSDNTINAEALKTIVKKSPIEIEFEICFAGIELNARLLSSLKAKYKLRKATCIGKSGICTQFSAEIADHQFYFHVTASNNGVNVTSSEKQTTDCIGGASIDTFTLQLPRIRANGSYKEPSIPCESSKQDGWDCAELVYRTEGYYDITIFISTMIHTFSTDLLNQILFAEQSFRSELAFLLERLSSERPKTASGASVLNVNPVLFNLEIKGESVPWLQITATTPTSVAVRFTVDNPHAVFTNRLIRGPSNLETTFASPSDSKIETSNEKIFDHCLFGRAKVQLNMKLGQLYKSALYEETQEELEEFANFMTQISVQNEDSIMKDSLHSFYISLNRPFLLIKSNAIDKAILLWLNYRNTYNYWRKEREKLLVNRCFEKNRKPKSDQLMDSAKFKEQSTNAATPVNKVNINLSLTIQNGLYVCMPLYSPEPSDNLATLMLSLQKSDVNVCIKKELSCNADFNAFKVSFIDNFDEQSLTEPWLYENVGEDSFMHSNYFFFPHGSYRFSTSAASPSAENNNAKWNLSVKSHMEGMIIDFDYVKDLNPVIMYMLRENYTIGKRKLTSLLVHTLSSSLTFDDEIIDDYAPSDSSFAFTTGGEEHTLMNGSMVDVSGIQVIPLDTTKQCARPRDIGSKTSAPLLPNSSMHAFLEPILSDELNAESEELSQVLGCENYIRWLERKMHEQSVLVTDLINLGASEFAIEKERRKLRTLELSRFKHFRKTIWDKIRQKVDQKFLSTESSASKKNEIDENSQKFSGNNETGHIRSQNFGIKKVKSHKRQSSRTMQVVQNSLVGEDGLKMAGGIGENSIGTVDSAAFNKIQQQPTESVDMNIDIQINIECGQCILRANQPSHSGSYTQRALTKRPSARDLKSKLVAGGNYQTITKLSIPSLSASMFYTSNDSIAVPPSYISQLFFHEKSQKLSPNMKNKCFYMALELASMPLETLITPCLADFLEQVVEPLPESLFESSTKPSSEQSSLDSNSMPIVVMDTSSLPLDVLFHMSVQSSSIRFEGQQQRSSAADCLLTLPGLTLTASTRKYDEHDKFFAGIYLSATLSSFSLNIYSPHQQSSAHDAFSLTLDRFSITASRSKNSSNNEDDRNRVELDILATIGSANFNYDMRRLSELITFPRPWYRKQLIRRLFFGEHSVIANPNYTSQRPESACSSSTVHHSIPKFKFLGKNEHSDLTGNRSSMKSASSANQLNQREWAASVKFSFNWKELNVNAQMSNTMGNTVWHARQGTLSGHLQLDSKKQRDVTVTFKLNSSELTAEGGAISGNILINDLLMSTHHNKERNKVPKNLASMEFKGIESRIEWMSRPTFIGRFVIPKILISDEWRYQRDHFGEVNEAVCLVNINGSWDDLQMIITKNTVGDMIKIGQKLILFFKEQLKNSRIVWDQEFFDIGDVTDSSDDGGSFLNGRRRRQYSKTQRSGFDKENLLSTSSCDSDSNHSSDYSSNYWQKILDEISNLQLRHNFLPLPTAADGVTFAGGNIQLRAERVSISCMNGEMNVSSWALFHMSDVGVLFNCRSNYTFLDRVEASKDLGIQLKEKLIFTLGESGRKLEVSHNTTKSSYSGSSSQAKQCSSSVPEASGYNAVVCRVQHNRGFLLRHNASIDLILEAIIGDVLKQLGEAQSPLIDPNTALSKSPPRFAHNVLRLFIFPPLEAVLCTTQNKEIVESLRGHVRMETTNNVQIVENTFVCKFYDAVCVQTDFNAQVGFLPDLLKSYMVSQSDVGNDTSLRKQFTYVSPSPSSAALSNASSSVATQRQPYSPSSSNAQSSSYNKFQPADGATKDLRQYVCLQWAVDPNIMFIDRFKWNPPVIDDILKKLQIFDHRQTIPKVMQRGVLDRCDILIANIIEQLLNQVKREL